jgi:hypothetical protein
LKPLERPLFVNSIFLSLSPQLCHTVTSFLESHQEPFGSSFLIGSGLSLVFLYRITPVDSAGTMRREDRVLGPEWEPMHALEINLISAQNLKPPTIQIWSFFIKPAQKRPFLAKPTQIRQWLCVCVFNIFSMMKSYIVMRLSMTALKAGDAKMKSYYSFLFAIPCVQHFLYDENNQ